MPKKPAPSPKDHLQSFRTLVEGSSLSRLKRHSGLEELTLEPTQDQSLVQGHWMGLVLVSARPFRMTYYVEFMSRDARMLAAPSYRKSMDEVTEAQAFDFVKEFCNLSGGKVKRVVEEQGVKVGLSLPLVIRGFDQIYLRVDAAGPNTFSARWKVGRADAWLHCSFMLTVLDEARFKRIQFDGVLDAEDEGDVKFLD